MIKAIYKITNNCNGKIYIGQSKDPYIRFKSHISRAKTNSSNMLIHKDMKLYGSQNFTMEILEWTSDPDKREQDYIVEYNSLSPNGYNELPGGIKTLPHKYGEEHHNSVISNEAVQFVKDALKNTNWTQQEIAHHVIPHINQVMVNAINMGHTHYDPNEIYSLRKDSPYHLSESDVKDVKWLLCNSQATVYEIAEYYHVSPGTIKHINSGRNYHDNNLKYPLHKRLYNVIQDSQPVETILAKRSTFTIDT